MALSLADPNAQRGFVFTFVGEGGLGKTNLACLFPSPVFIRAEDGLLPPHIARYPVCETTDQIIAQITELAQEQHQFRTLVIDSITQANVMAENEIVASDPKAKSINTAMGGYGAGQGAVSAKHMAIRAWCDLLSTQRGMHIVFLAHASAEIIKPPDADDYYRYSIRMNHRSVSHYSDNTDCVGYIRLQTFQRETAGERQLAISDGRRVISCYPQASSIAKNRFNITQDLPYEQNVNPFAQLVGQ